jgi:hypothetical protein
MLQFSKCLVPLLEYDMLSLTPRLFRSRVSREAETGRLKLRPDDRLISV